MVENSYQKKTQMRYPEEINEVISQRAKEGRTLKISGLKGQDRIAIALPKPAKLILEGEVGDYLGALNQKCEIYMRGSVGRFMSWHMRGGIIEVRGTIGDEAALGMTGGRILIRGDVKGSLFSYGRGGVVVVRGSVVGDVAFGATGGLVVVEGSIGGNLKSFGTQVLVRPSELPLLKQEGLNAIPPPEKRKLLQILGEYVPGNFDEYMIYPPSPTSFIERKLEDLIPEKTPFAYTSSLNDLGLVLDPLKPSLELEEIYLKSGIGGGERSLVLLSPFFIPHHFISALNPVIRRALLGFSLKRRIPVMIDLQNIEEEERKDIISGVPYISVLTSEGRFPPDEMLRKSEGIAIDLLRKLTGKFFPWREVKNTKDLSGMIRLLKNIKKSPIFAYIPASSVMRDVGITALSGADAVVVTGKSAPLGLSSGGFCSPPFTRGDLETLSEASLAKEELSSKGVKTAILLDGGIRDVDGVIKAISMGSSAVALSHFILEWLGCRRCAKCRADLCPINILNGSGKPLDDWDVVIEVMLEKMNKLEKALRFRLAQMGLKGIQELSKKNLVALNKNSALLSSLPLSGRGRRVVE